MIFIINNNQLSFPQVIDIHSQLIHIIIKEIFITDNNYQ